jgi:gluconate 2-dehydrogenase gamma chain
MLLALHLTVMARGMRCENHKWRVMSAMTGRRNQWLDRIENRLMYTRRRIVLGLSFVVGAIGFAAPARALASVTGAIPPSERDDGGPLQFFEPGEYAFISAAVARLIPADADGPGAAEAEAQRYIDRKLAGPGGGANGWYMDGPFKPGKPTQGWQINLTPAQLYRTTIVQMQAAARRAHGAPFDQLPAERQDEFLSSMQQGRLDSDDVRASLFFGVLLNDTVEGLMADPLYGGNKDFIGWKMIGHPGVRYDWRPWLQHDGPVDLPIVGMYGPAAKYRAGSRR